MIVGFEISRPISDFRLAHVGRKAICVDPLGGSGEVCLYEIGGSRAWFVESRDQSHGI